MIDEAAFDVCWRVFQKHLKRSMFFAFVAERIWTRVAQDWFWRIAKIHNDRALEAAAAMAPGE